MIKHTNGKVKDVDKVQLKEAKKKEREKNREKRKAAIKEWFKDHKTEIAVTAAGSVGIVAAYIWYKNANAPAPASIEVSAPIPKVKTVKIDPIRVQENIAPEDISFLAWNVNLGNKANNAERLVQPISDKTAEGIKEALSNYIDSLAEEIDISKVDDMTLILEHLDDIKSAYEGIEMTCF